MEDNKDLIEPLDMRQELLYGSGADITIDFKNGEVIKVNKTILAYHSKFFVDNFFGSSPKTTLEIENFDCETFKTFLDCLFGLKEYSSLDALLIYPIAHQYGVKESLEKCAVVLKPKEMDENVWLALNLAVFYKNDKLINEVIYFIKSKKGMVTLMENEDNCSLLEPSAMCKLLEEVDLYSSVWRIVYVWAKNYLGKHNNFTSVNALLKEHHILSKIKLTHFESVQCILDFHKFSDWQMLDSKELFCYLESNLLKLKNDFPAKSEWVENVKTLTEKVEFSHSRWFYKRSNKLNLVIRTNQIFTENFNQNIYFTVDIKVRYFFRNISSNLHLYCYKHQPSFEKACCDCCRATASFNVLSDHKIEVISTTFKEFLEKPSYSFLISALYNDQILEFKGVEITYEFKNFSEFRILKTSLNDEFSNFNELYFTKNILLE